MSVATSTIKTVLDRARRIVESSTVCPTPTVSPQAATQRSVQQRSAHPLVTLRFRTSCADSNS